MLGAVLEDKSTAMNLHLEPTIINILNRVTLARESTPFSSMECRAGFSVKLMNSKCHGRLLSWVPSKVLCVLLTNLGSSGCMEC